MDKIAGYLEIGTNDKGEVVINHSDLKPDADGVGHIAFSPQQARALAAMLNRKAAEFDGGTAQERTAMHEEWTIAKATRAALAKTIEELRNARRLVLDEPFETPVQRASFLARIEAILADPTGKAAYAEWQTMRDERDAFAGPEGTDALRHIKQAAEQRGYDAAVDAVENFAIKLASSNLTWSNAVHEAVRAVRR